MTSQSSVFAEIIKELISQSSMIITALAAFYAAIRSNKAAKVGKENSDAINLGNDIAKDAKQEAQAARKEAVDAKLLFSDRMEGISEDVRKQAAEAMKSAVTAAKIQAESSSKEEINKLRNEIVRLNQILVHRHSVTDKIQEDVRALRNASESGSFPSVKDDK